MPEQKGKRKTKRERRRLGSPAVIDESSPAPAPVRQSRGARPAAPRRRGYQAPLWLNATIGVVMLAFGVAYFFTTSANARTGTSVLLLVAYLVVAGFYLIRAARQWMARRQS